MHALPELAELEAEFQGHPAIVFVGVHCAKFDNEKQSDGLRDAIIRHDIRHPVVNDPERHLWKHIGLSGPAHPPLSLSLWHDWHTQAGRRW